MTSISMTAIEVASLKINRGSAQFAHSLDKNAFEALLKNFDNDSDPSQLMDIASAMAGLIAKFQVLNFGAPVNFPFSPSFVSTFGTSGPLPVYIAAKSAELKLTSAKQIAIQDICVRNKDITYTRENVQKIAAELTAAGITSA